MTGKGNKAGRDDRDYADEDGKTTAEPVGVMIMLTMSRRVAAAMKGTTLTAKAMGTAASETAVLMMIKGI